MINTEEAIKWLTFQKNKGIQWDTGPTEDILMKAIIESRIRESYDMAIDALSERKTGKWIKVSSIAEQYEWSECGRHIFPHLYEDLSVYYPYCHCGAKMVKEEK